MNRDDFRRFSAALTAASELYGRPVSEGALSLWWDALNGYDVEQVEQALRATIRDPDGGQFMPKPADLIRRIDGTAVDRSLIAWGKVLEAIRRVGAYSSVVFDDGAIHAAIDDMGGWPKLCRGKVDELPFVQRRFCDTHRTYSARPDLPYPPRLVGEHEAGNALRGHEIAPPAIVGDPERARLVQARGDGVGGRVPISFTAPRHDLRATAVKRIQGDKR
jgi:hypothetical protein